MVVAPVRFRPAVVVSRVVVVFAVSLLENKQQTRTVSSKQLMRRIAHYENMLTRIIRPFMRHVRKITRYYCNNNNTKHLSNSATNLLSLSVPV